MPPAVVGALLPNDRRASPQIGPMSLDSNGAEASDVSSLHGRLGIDLPIRRADGPDTGAFSSIALRGVLIRCPGVEAPRRASLR
jgi:hypothetical protein